MVDSIVEALIAKHRERANMGKRKYGTTLDRNDLTWREWLRHKQEEDMDSALYAEKLLNEPEHPDVQRLKAIDEQRHASWCRQNNVLMALSETLAMWEAGKLTADEAQQKMRERLNSYHQKNAEDFLKARKGESK